MELLNEWLPLIVTVLLSLITIGLYIISVEITVITDICRVQHEKPKPNKVQEVKVVNRVEVDVLNDVGVEVKSIVRSAGAMKVEMDHPISVSVDDSSPLVVRGIVNVENVVRTTPYREDVY
jgi:hypothetical protein